MKDPRKLNAAVQHLIEKISAEIYKDDMTLPDERLRALRAAREFMCALLDSQQTPRVPSTIRKWASSVLKHYPMPIELDLIGSHRLLRAPKQPCYDGKSASRPRPKRR